MRNCFDHLAKNIGKEALGPSGLTVVHDEISPDAHHADLRHEPDPAREAERARLGLLGRIAAVLCLIEIYGRAPEPEEFRACLTKHFVFWQQRVSKARMHQARAHKKKQKKTQHAPVAFVAPFLWIIAAGAPAAIITKLKFDVAPGWPPGVYFFGDDLLRVGLVVANELPRDRSTLLVRLMAAGPLLPQAIEDLAALPPDAHERAVAEQILLNLQHALGAKPSRTPEEQEFVMVMHSTWEDAREEGRKEGRNEARNEARNEGRIEGEAQALLTVLAARGIAVPEDARERILAQKDPACLTRWLQKAATAPSLAEVLDEPS
jgi:hypothetical protein